MKKISYLLLIVIVAFSGIVFTSCKKQAVETNMIVRKWTLASKTIAGINVASDCEKLAKWDFKSNGTYALLDACNTTKTGTWKLAADGNSLTLDNVDSYTVITSSLSSLVIEMQVGGIGLTKWSFN